MGHGRLPALIRRMICGIGISRALITLIMRVLDEGRSGLYYLYSLILTFSQDSQTHIAE